MKKKIQISSKFPCRAKQSENWDLGTQVQQIRNTFDHFEVIWVQLSQNVMQLKNMMAVERNELEFGIRGVLVEHIWGSFDLVVFKVSLKSFSALFSKWSITPEQQRAGRKLLKFGTRATYILYL